MKARILIIDDEKHIRFTVKEFLLKDGYDVSAVENFDEALKILNTECIDVVLTDIVLEGKTGIDLLRVVNEKHLNCPVIVFTGYPNLESASESVRLGAYDYMAKPVKKEALLRVIGMALRHKTLVEEKNSSHANLKAIFQSVTDAIITVDKDLKVIELNDAAKTICGFSREEVMGKSIDSIPKTCCGHCVDAIKKTILEKRPLEIYRTECMHQTRKGQLVTLKTFPLTDGIDGCVIVVKDETHIFNLEKELEGRQRFYNSIGKDKEMQAIYSLIENLQNIDTTVLLTGESGTGKGLIAEAIHNGGVRRQGPLIKVDCSALTETLLESELFGHVKGSFTSAISDKEGRFQKADGGTIFLDEIGDASLSVQQRLLKVIQEKEFERVGDATPIKVDVRVVAATNQNLQEEVRLKRFRKDLYYRLNIVEISIPPLRDRKADIPLLVEHFIKMFRKKINKDINELSSDVYNLFMNYEWPGNIRELQNAIEHSFIVCNKTVITVEDLPKEFREIKTTRSMGEKSCGHDRILQALEKTHWNKASAAKLLGISRRSVYNKIKEYNIRPEKSSM
ncbi:transcriptional regulator [Candidatus Scalindua japonica]|uniref:Transcriptional regulator n=1 Tax=Candidatus Scalindua japonica TaxID=1284222 RepID=A0A286U1Y1_9BACT|nr:sigma 54-interacting transcriptional regulator [Candidatus Scalindua japonica]GAX62144.1 transcriptional regulator [Candidatus Scalindua japonica]